MARPQLSRPIQRPVQQPQASEPVRIPDFSLVSEEKKEALLKEARERIEAKEIALAEQAFLEAEIARLDRERHPEAHEEMVDYFIDGLALYADRIVLDGKTFMFGRTYKVRKSVALVFDEIMQRTRRHEAEIKSGDNYTTFYNKMRAGQWDQKQAGVGKQFSVGSNQRTGF